MTKIIKKCLNDNLRIAQDLLRFEEKIEVIVRQVVGCLEQDGKLIFLGNGGSAADAMHIAGEYVNKFSKMRKSLPAIAISDNVAVLTAIANDIDYEYVFARQLESLANKNDLVIGFTTSGESKNVIRAIKYCKMHKIRTISFTGSKKNTAARISNICLQIPSDQTARIQESYLMVNHIICEIVDNYFR